MIRNRILFTKALSTHIIFKIFGEAFLNKLTNKTMMFYSDENQNSDNLFEDFIESHNELFESYPDEKTNLIS